MNFEQRILPAVAIIAIITVVAAGVVYYTYNSGGITGFVTDTATANVTVSSTAAINFTVDNIDWGSGSVIIGQENATLDTSTGTTVGGQGFTNVSQGFVLENVGNVNVSVDLKSLKTAQQLLGGTNPSFQWNVTNLETSSCVSQGSGFGTWEDVETDPYTICSNFGFKNNADTMRIDLKVVVPSDSNTGKLSDTITATANSIEGG